MKIIDAHMHLFPTEESYGRVMAEAVGHQSSVTYLRSLYQELNIEKAVVMGNVSLDPAYHDYPADLFHYCIGLDTHVMRKELGAESLALVEENLQRENCCGVKLYPGYVKRWLSDPCYYPIYQLAQQYGKPVAVHMGLTAHPRAHLKYSHPMALDEVASDFRKTKFVMCHFANPFLQDAVAVLCKNPNVSTDLSGLIEGAFQVEEYLRDYEGYSKMLKDWLAYGGCWERIMFGTDFPIVNYSEYLRFISTLVPEHHWDKVFFDNANYVYKLGL